MRSFNTGRMPKEKLKAAILADERCQICVTKFVMKKKSNNPKRPRLVRIFESKFSKALTSQILSINLDIFPGENSTEHRFCGKLDYYICGRDHVKFRSEFLKNRLKPKRPFFGWLRNLSSSSQISESEFSEFSQSQQSQSSEMNEISESSLMLNDEQGLENTSSDSQADSVIQISEHSEVPDSSVDFSTFESFDVRFDHNSDTEEYVPVLNVSDSDEEGNLSEEESDPEVVSEEIEVPLIWRKYGKKIDITMYEFGATERDVCSVCDTRMENLQKFSLSNLWDLIENEAITLKNWESLNVCKWCFEDGQFTISSKEILELATQKKILKNQSKLHLGSFLQDFCDQFRDRKREEACIAKQLKAHGANFRLNYMSDSDLLQFCYHTKAQIRDIISYCIRGGLKKGTKLEVDQKVIIYLMFLKLNLSHCDISVLFKVDQSTISRARMDVERSLTASVSINNS